MKRTDKVYLVWVEENDVGYWNQYESLEDAVGSHQADAENEGYDGVEIYEATPKLLGIYSTKVSVVKKKSKKK